MTALQSFSYRNQELFSSEFSFTLHHLRVRANPTKNLEIQNRKSIKLSWNKSMADSDNDSGGGHGNYDGKSDLSTREQDRLLPIANVSRIMKKALQANAKISKDSKETVQECVSEFISFITGEASDKCQREKRKTINGDDLLWAMTALGFEDYVDPLKIYLQRFREMEGEKSSVGAARDKEGVIVGDGGSVNMRNSVGDYGTNNGIYGGMGSSMMIMGHHHQGQVYGSGGFHQVTMAGAGSVVGHNGPRGSTGRPR